ncbi:DUF4910 domain-containing protein [Candidatus Pelagibacter bacterium nBUS_44]|uniref:DUF4910 domain-containing protein n=1 Tax=Candidatus Pelagibacter bacterium nBUS_44 TaxID=3374195 RepID=UPI003EBDA55C
MIEFIKKNFYSNRSITGPGIKNILKYLKKLHPKMKFIKFNSGEKIYDWTIPYEWDVKKAYIDDDKGKRIIDFKNNNLHLVGFSRPINKWIKKKELLKKIHTHKIKSAIPYITSYYKKDWGFCVSKNDLKKFKSKKYKVLIDSKFEKGTLDIGEITFKGKMNFEIFFSTYVCHPSMANNELTGPAVQNKLIEYVSKLKNRNFSYRFVFLPETIGSIAYINKKLDVLKKNIISGFNLSCLGAGNEYSMICSREGRTLPDQLLKKMLKKKEKYKIYSFLSRGSDERQYCAPGIDLPLVTLCRSKFGKFKEYHTHLDDLKFIKKKTLDQSFELLKNLIEIHENKIFYEIKELDEKNLFPKTNIMCEPFLTKYNLMSGLTSENNYQKIQQLMNVLVYCDGKKSIYQISSFCKIEIKKLISILKILKNKKLIYF